MENFSQALRKQTKGELFSHTSCPLSLDTNVFDLILREIILTVDNILYQNLRKSRSEKDITAILFYIYSNICCRVYILAHFTAEIITSETDMRNRNIFVLLLEFLLKILVVGKASNSWSGSGLCIVTEMPLFSLPLELLQ